jgi:hypothetical protein
MPITSQDMQQPVALGPHTLPPVVALGGANDGIVMEYQLQDAAEFFGARAVVVPGLAHDLMLVSPYCLHGSLFPCDHVGHCIQLKWHRVHHLFSKDQAISQ